MNSNPNGRLLVPASDIQRSNPLPVQPKVLGIRLGDHDLEVSLLGKVPAHG